MESLQKMERDIPSYLQFDKENFSVKLLAKPAFAEVPYAVQMEPHLITEFYSR
jgi:small subunit ribosomal protein S4